MPSRAPKRGSDHGRGYFEIGLVASKCPHNLGTLWRSAYQLGAAGIFLVGPRYQRQPSDTVKAWRHVPLRVYDELAAFLAARPYDCPMVGVEIGGTPLRSFRHPDRAVYVLGAEDNGLPASVRQRCAHVVEIEAARTASFNVATAGALVMYHRLIQRREGGEPHA